MKNEYTQLENLQLARPCPIKLDGLDPAEKENFCQSCKKTVYNLSVMPTDEAEALLVEKGGKGCFMFVRTDDGRIITDNCPLWLRPLRKYARMAAAVSSLIAIWLLTQKRAIAQHLVTAPIDPRYSCSKEVIPASHLKDLYTFIPLDERGLWTTGLSLLAAWCTWLALMVRSQTETTKENVELSHSFYFLTLMLVVIFAPFLLGDGHPVSYCFDQSTKHYVLLAGPIVALCLWLWISIAKNSSHIAAETVALVIAIPVSLAASIESSTAWWNEKPELLTLFSYKMFGLFAWVGIATFIDELFRRKSQLTIARAIALIVTPPLLLFICNQVLLDATLLVPAIVGLSCVTVLLRKKVIGVIASSLYVPPFFGLMWCFIFGGPGVRGQLADLGYDTARDMVRCAVVLALAFACATIWWYKLKQRKLTPQSLLLLLSIPIFVHLIGTFVINNFGGLGGGGI